MRHLVASYSHFDKLTPARIVARAAAPWSFKRDAEPEISYSFLSERHTIVDYLSRYPTTGLLSLGTTLFSTSAISTRDPTVTASTMSRCAHARPTIVIFKSIVERVRGRMRSAAPHWARNNQCPLSTGGKRSAAMERLMVD
jgi:hypothetical protein